MKKSIPLRKDRKKDDCWNLASLFSDDGAWEQAKDELINLVPGMEAFKGRLGESPSLLAQALTLLTEIERKSERLGYYAMLRYSEDLSDPQSGKQMGVYSHAAAEAEGRLSFVLPEIQKIPQEKMRRWQKSPKLQDFRIYLEKILRFKPHVLSEKEEWLLSRLSPTIEGFRKTFSSLNNVDLNFGSVMVKGKKVPLTITGYGLLLQNPDREVRRRAFLHFYKVYDAHKHTLADLYHSSVQYDLYAAEARGYSSARAANLFKDNIPESVYENLVDSVNGSLKVLHRYYELRRRVLKLKRLNLYDMRVNLIPEVKTRYSYEEAVDLIAEALAPLGREYTSVMKAGLLGGWVDRYENKGKRSGAFSAGTFDGDPYILMNYRDENLRDVFTLAHEAGHSMHSRYSAKNNPFRHYNYTIFEAETASTFNEELLFSHLLRTKGGEDKKLYGYLLNQHLDEIIATLFRQTMFSEYEHRCHELAAEGRPLTVDVLRGEYGNLLRKYFGEGVYISRYGDLEGMRIPHFYRSYYVYKYATGISAAITLARGVEQGGKPERDAYLEFLKSGGSRYPLESLRVAGVDMTDPAPVRKALEYFENLVTRLETFLSENGLC